MKTFVYFKGKKISVEVKRTGFFSKGFGLMFRTKQTSNLLFEFKSKTNLPFTSLFVFFRFLIIWVDENDKVINCEIVRPFRLSIFPKKAYRKVIELPLNKRNSKIINFFVGKGERFK